MFFILCLLIKSEIFCNYSDLTRVPFRVFYYIHEEDNLKCSYIDQKIIINGIEKTCDESNILTNLQKNSLIETLNSLSTFISKFINISRNFDEMIPINNSELGLIVPNINYNTDLFISITLRPLEMDEIHPQHFKYNENDNRPIQGHINIPPFYIPLESQNKNSIENHFFMKILHDTVHVMGFTENYMKKWYNRKTGFSWGDLFPISKIKHPKYQNINLTILHTPQVNYFSFLKYKIKEIFPNVPVGIELEDYSIHKGHPKSRIYLNDFLVSDPLYFPLEITQFSIGIIEDMGWYTPNYEFALSLDNWGETSENGFHQPINNFINESPRKVFPSNYLCNYSEQLSCSYDYKFLSECSTSSFTCPDEPGTDNYEFCLKSNYYNPNFDIYRGNFRTADFLPLKKSYPSISCRTNYSKNSIIGSKKAEKLNMTIEYSSRCTKLVLNDGNIDLGCYQTQCLDNGKVQIKLLNKYYFCSYENQILNVLDHPEIKEIVCPNPKYLCDSYFDSVLTIQRNWYVPLPADPPLKDDDTEKIIVKSSSFITFWTAIFTAIIIPVIIIVINRKKKNSEQDSEFKNLP